MDLDRKLEYQFGFFFAGGQTKVSREAIASLRRHFDDGGSSALRLKFGDAVVDESVVAHGAQLVQLPTVTWTSGHWRMVWTPLRLDVYADAKMYEEVKEKPLPLDTVAARLVGGLKAAAAELGGLGFVVNRLVVVVGGERGLSPDAPESLALVADRFLGPEVRDAVRRRDAWDVGARVDWGTHFDLGADGKVPVHRIETVGTELSYVGKTSAPNLILRAQWDVNTSPRRGAIQLSPDGFEPFYTAATEWISRRRAELGAT